MSLEWLSNLTRPFSSLLNPLAERVGSWLGRRKPGLYIHFMLNQLVWCIAQEPQRTGPPRELMQVAFWADLNHDDPKHAIIITAAFPKDTQPQHGLISNIVIPPNQMVHEQVVAIV